MDIIVLNYSHFTMNKNLPNVIILLNLEMKLSVDKIANERIWR